MNSEKNMTLEMIFEAMNIVEKARALADISSEERLQLEKVSVLLRKMERDIIRLKTTQLLSNITEDAKALQELALKMEKKAAKIGKISEILEKTAKVVDLFVQVASKTLSAGIA